MREKLSKRLKDPTKAARYLNRALEYGEAENLQCAFIDLMEARGGWKEVARKSGLAEWRVKLLVLDKAEAWSLLRLDKLLKGMGVRLAVVKGARK